MAQIAPITVGLTHVAPIPQPALGADWQYQLPRPQRVLTIRGTFTASAVVANRIVQLLIDDQNGDTLWGFEFNNAIAASQAATINWWRSTALQFLVGAHESSAVLPDLLLPLACRIRANTLGRDVGDQWSSLVLTYSDT